MKTDAESIVKEAVYRVLDRLAADARSKNATELEIKVGDMQKNVQEGLGDGGFLVLRQICSSMREKPLISLAGLEHIDTNPPDSCLLETRFRYRVHTV